MSQLGDFVFFATLPICRGVSVTHCLPNEYKAVKKRRMHIRLSPTLPKIHEKSAENTRKSKNRRQNYRTYSLYVAVILPICRTPAIKPSLYVAAMLPICRSNTPYMSQQCSLFVAEKACNRMAIS